MSNLIPVQDIERMASSVARSGLFGIKTTDQAIALMLVANAEGMHPAVAARDYHVINGKPSLKADAMLARFQNAGGKVAYSILTDERVEATFSHPAGGSATIAWTIDMAKRAGLLSNPTWTKYPRQMLRARVISEGIRTVFPGVIGGMYTPEEQEDIAVANGQPVPPSVSQTIDMGPAVVEATSNERLAEIEKKLKECQSLDDLEALRPEIRELHGEQRKEMISKFMVRADELQPKEADDAEHS